MMVKSEVGGQLGYYSESHYLIVRKSLKNGNYGKRSLKLMLMKLLTHQNHCPRLKQSRQRLNNADNLKFLDQCPVSQIHGHQIRYKKSTLIQPGFP